MKSCCRITSFIVAGVRLRHFSTSYAVYIEDCEGWWLSGCRSSFHFPLFSPQTHLTCCCCWMCRFTKTTEKVDRADGKNCRVSGTPGGLCVCGRDEVRWEGKRERGKE